MPDFKKLITGFLILAAITSSSALMFSDIFSKQQIRTANQTAQISSENAQGAPSISANAFVETLPESGTQLGNTSAGNVDASGGSAASAENLTEGLSKNLLEAVVKANPQGPQDASGQINLAQPDLDNLFQNVAKEPAVKKLQLPDWEAEANALKFAVIEKPSEADMGRYNAALEELMNTYVVQSNLIGIVDAGSADPKSQANNFARPAEIIGNALAAEERTPVPKQFADLHRSGLKLLSYMQNALDLANNASADPLKAALIIDAQKKNYNLAVQNLKNEYFKAANSGLLSVNKKTSGVVAVVNFLLGVKTAHAGYPTIDIPTLAQIATSLWQWVLDTLLMILKQYVVKSVLNQIVGFVQNGGTPYFITNWKSFLENIANQVAGSAINAIDPQFCSYFGPLLRFSLLSGMSQQFNGYYSSCTLSQVVSNMTAFYNSFQYGGWVAYTTMFQGDNNIFAASIDAPSYIASEAQKAVNAAHNEGASSKGFLGVKKCPAGSTQVNTGCATWGAPGTAPTITDPVTVTPGTALADEIGNAFGHGPDAVENSNDSLASIFLTFVAQVTDALVQKGLKNLLGAARF